MVSEDEVINYIFDYIRPAKICMDSKSTKHRLRQDLQIDGDDAAEFLDAFSSHFEVDLTGFEFLEYFLSEGELNSNILTRVIHSGLSNITKQNKLSPRPASAKTKSITLGHLVSVAQSKHWHSPE